MKTPDNRKEIKFINYKAYIITFAVLGVCILLLNIMFRVSTVFANVYCRTVYHALARALSAIMSIFPFSFIEVLCILAALIVLYCIARLIISIIKYHEKTMRHFIWYRLKKYLLNLTTILLSIGLIYSLTCMPLYHRLSFSVCANIIPTEHSKEDLIKLYRYLAKDANFYADKVSRDSDGIFSIDGVDYNEISVDAMVALHDDYPVLSNYYPPAKPVMASKIMSKTLTMGFYCPYTMEANYNKDMPDLDLPHTICHELSHLSGFIHEDEANFIGYLACLKTDSPEFHYSGTVNMIFYLMNQLYDNCSKDEYYDLLDELDDVVIRDIQKEDAYWEAFRHTKVSKAASSANDAYIKANGDSEGEKRYDMVTDLLLEYYKDVY